MSSMTFGQKIFQPKPPIQGSFPLDHDGDCKKEMLEYMLCIKREKNDNSKCRLQAKEYLNCRMNNNLMEKRDLETFGYREIVENEQNNK
ncbi:unnamed protein product [Brachionus calyciflorus]|uniref:Cytochrome c oxidase assembly protein COX19 n=1 Tax=Brachionus calyciflorus TaxID=104777 RepID=A0A813VM57_9BILA|nr:unnamed protein product [Brachionus calyciflorus]